MEGEVNSQYSDKAIYANFKRILGEYNWRGNENLSETQKANTFVLKVGCEVRALKVDVYPYRDGSKARYSFGFGELKKCVTDEDIKNAHIQIAKIVND
ncbi:MAG: hypothetical protein LBP89_07440 [Helicobacteraceae bacterium]|nr:hypothetical protein [Helicobacteraceae bacterium]